MIATASFVVAGVSALFAKQSADTSKRQLALIERKVGMVTDPSKMTEVLPVWYVDRMGQDNWGFGLLLASGGVACDRAHHRRLRRSSVAGGGAARRKQRPQGCERYSSHLRGPAGPHARFRPRRSGAGRVRVMEQLGRCSPRRPPALRPLRPHLSSSFEGARRR